MGASVFIQTLNRTLKKMSRLTETQEKIHNITVQVVQSRKEIKDLLQNLRAQHIELLNLHAYENHLIYREKVQKLYKELIESREKQRKERRESKLGPFKKPGACDNRECNGQFASNIPHKFDEWLGICIPRFKYHDLQKIEKFVEDENTITMQDFEAGLDREYEELLNLFADRGNSSED